MRKNILPALLLLLLGAALADWLSTDEAHAQAFPPSSGGTSYTHPSAISLSNGIDSRDGGTFTGPVTFNSGIEINVDGGSSAGITFDLGTAGTSKLYVDTSGFLHSTVYTEFDGPVNSGSAAAGFRSLASSGNPGFKCYYAGCRICLTEACTDYLASDGSGTLYITAAGLVGINASFGAYKDARAWGTENYYQRLTGTIKHDASAVGNVGTGEDTLITYNLASNALNSTNNHANSLLSIRVTAWGTGANNANAKTLKCYFGSTVVLTHSLPTSEAIRWRVTFDVIQTGANAQDYNSLLVHNGSTTPTDVELGSSTENQGAAITIKCTGEATADDDIKQEVLIVEAL